MEIEFAQLIVDAADDEGLEVRLYEKYSGRGMYGKTTAGVVGSFADILSAAVRAAADMDPEEDPDKIEEFVQDMQDIRTDNMAMDMIVY